MRFLPPSEEISRYLVDYLCDLHREEPSQGLCLCRVSQYGHMVTLCE